MSVHPVKDNAIFRGRREKLVRDLAAKGIRQQAVLQAIGQVLRHGFVEKSFEAQAYEDTPLPIAEGQTISQPYTVAFQTELLQVKKGDRLLEIGTGSGYQCAVLCAMGANVFSIERHRPLYTTAKQKLAELGYHPTLKQGDGTLGWEAYAPYDGILVTAGSPGIPENLKNQLAVGGRLVIPVGEADRQTMTLVIKKSATEYEISEFADFRFVPLLGKQGWAEKK